MAIIAARIEELRRVRLGAVVADIEASQRYVRERRATLRERGSMLPARTGFPLNAAAVLLNVAANYSTTPRDVAPQTQHGAPSWPRRAGENSGRPRVHHARQPQLDGHAQTLQLHPLPQRHSLSPPSAIRSAQVPDVVLAAQHWEQEQEVVVFAAIMIHLAKRLFGRES